MLASLKGLTALVVAGLAALSTYASLGHVHAPVVHRAAVVQPASTDLEVISGDLNTTTPPLPKPTPPPAPDESQSQPAADQGGSSGPAPAPAVAPRPAPPPAPAPPPVVVGSAQQAYINADRAAAGLPPLTWSSCLAGIAAGWSRTMAAANPKYNMQHGNGVSLDFSCGLGSTHTGENIGWWSGGVNDAQLNTMFMNSPDHRANIMGPYHYVGTAWAVASDGTGYITVEFA